MFEAVRNNKRVAQVILALLIVPFAFFGMDAYFSDSGSANEAARVGGTTIGAWEFDQALREQQDRLRQDGGARSTVRCCSRSNCGRAVLENLINQRVLALYAAENRLVVTPQQLRRPSPAWPPSRKTAGFSLSQRYETPLRAQGMTPATFEARLAQDVRVRSRIVAAVGDAGIVPEASAARRFLDAQLESRSVREFRLSAKALAADVKGGRRAGQRLPRVPT